MKYPALDVRGVEPDLVVATAQDFSPSAVDEQGDTVTIFFGTVDPRDAAARAIQAAWPSATVATRDVDDEDWARRSQEGLTPITVGRITVAPPWSPPGEARADAASLVLVVTPSMGFGTGHHATTRLCLAALQTLDLAGGSVLDVGTGSGILALAARALGAQEALGVDSDPDAIQSANENLAANPAIDRVRFLTGDLRTVGLPVADIVTANLTGALLVQAASLLRQSVRGGGSLILSGLLTEERDAVLSAFSGLATLTWEAQEQGWSGLLFTVSAENEV